MTVQVEAGNVPEWHVGDFLRKARENAGLEQAQLAADLGISRNTVTNYERGKVKPRRAVVMAWAMRTGVPVWWLEGRENPHQGGPDGGVELLRLDSNQRPSGYMSAQVIEGPWCAHEPVAPLRKAS